MWYINDGYVQDTKVLIADEEHDDKNRKSCHHEGIKDGVHMINQLHADAGVIDDNQNNISRMKTSKTIHDVIPKGRGRIKEDHAERHRKS